MKRTILIAAVCLAYSAFNTVKAVNPDSDCAATDASCVTTDASTTDCATTDGTTTDASALSDLSLSSHHRGGGDNEFSYGANASYIKFLGSDLKTSHPGIGLRAWWDKDKYLLSVSANYFFSANSSYSSTSEVPTGGVDMFGNPIYAPATTNYTTAVHVFQIDLRLNYYFVGDHDDDFGFYGTVGVGYMLETDNTTTTGAAPADAIGSNTNAGFMIDLGLGVAKKFDFGFLFLEGGISFPPFSANSEDGTEVDTNIPAFFQINAGIRIPIE